jgi:hypothetical protein
MRSTPGNPCIARTHAPVDSPTNEAGESRKQGLSEHEVKLIAREFTAQIGRRPLENRAPVACGGLAMELEGWIPRTVLAVVHPAAVCGGAGGVFRLKSLCKIDGTQ